MHEDFQCNQICFHKCVWIEGSFLALAGYTGTVTEVSPVCYSDPGMSNANMQFAVVDVDADAPENASIKPELEVGDTSSTLHRTQWP